LIGELRCNLIAFRPPPLRHACGCRYLTGVPAATMPPAVTSRRGKGPSQTPASRTSYPGVASSSHASAAKRTKQRGQTPTWSVSSGPSSRHAPLSMVKSDVAVHVVECHNSRTRRARHRSTPAHLRLEFGHRHHRLRRRRGRHVRGHHRHLHLLPARYDLHRLPPKLPQWRAPA
jgi:hypothetical protein